MRLAYNDFGFINIEGVFVGISLGYDFTAEHEWGIKGITRELGIPKLTRRTMGIKSRTCTAKSIKDKFYFATKGEYAFLIMSGHGRELPKRNARYSLETKLTEEHKILPHDFREYKQIIERNTNNQKDPIISAWSEGSFGIIVKGEEEKENLQSIYNAFLDHNAAITFMNLSPNVFGNASLSLLIIDRIPGDSLQEMRDADKQALDLEWLQNKLNLRERLQKTEKFGEYSLHYCGAKFENYDPKKSKKQNCRKENLRVWTNSSDYYGWNTVEEIEELINDKNLTLDEFKSRHKD